MTRRTLARALTAGLVVAALALAALSTAGPARGAAAGPTVTAGPTKTPPPTLAAVVYAPLVVRAAALIQD